MSLELIRLHEETDRYRVEAPNETEFYIRRQPSPSGMGHWGAWEDEFRRDKEPTYQHAQLTHLVAMIEAKERPLGELYDQDVRKFIKSRMAQARAYQDTINEVMAKARLEVQPVSNAIDLINEQVDACIAKPLGFSGRRLAHGSYECPTSPTGHCVYDDRKDHLHDHCLFCHDPSERK